MQIALSVGGVLMMIVAATLLNLIKIKPRQQPTVALPMDVRAQPREGWGTVGWRLLEAFRRGLRKFGWADRQNLVIDSRYAEGQSDRLPSLADELVRLKADVIAAKSPLVSNGSLVPLAGTTLSFLRTRSRIRIAKPARAHSAFGAGG